MIVVRGSYRVLIEGIVHDCYDVQIEFGLDFPEVAPLLIERAERIPRIVDRHMYPNTDGWCCFGVWAEWLATGPRTIERFLLETVHDFFFSQYYYELHPELEEADRWPIGERSHGQQGIVEGCARVLGVPPTIDAILGAIGYILGEDRDRNATCLCGSGRRFKRCHRSRFWQLRSELDPVAIKSILDALK